MVLGLAVDLCVTAISNSSVILLPKTVQGGGTSGYRSATFGSLATVAVTDITVKMQPLWSGPFFEVIIRFSVARRHIKDVKESGNWT